MIIRIDEKKDRDMEVLRTYARGITLFALREAYDIKRNKILKLSRRLEVEQFLSLTIRRKGRNEKL